MWVCQRNGEFILEINKWCGHFSGWWVRSQGESSLFLAGHRKVRQKELERERNMIELALLCDRMDLDASGTLSVEEMILGYEQEPKMSLDWKLCSFQVSTLIFGNYNLFVSDILGSVNSRI